jgi:hypothetical protein
MHGFRSWFLAMRFVRSSSILVMLLISLPLLHAKTMMFMGKRTGGINRTINFRKQRWHVNEIIF